MHFTLAAIYQTSSDGKPDKKSSKRNHLPDHSDDQLSPDVWLTIDEAQGPRV